MDKLVIEKLRQARTLWAQVEALDETRRFILDVLLDSQGGKALRIQEALEVSKSTAYRYIEDVLSGFSNISD